MESFKLQIDKLLDTLEGVLCQACEDNEGIVDSRALSYYADGLRLLAKYKRFKITSQFGRRVIGVWCKDV